MTLSQKFNITSVAVLDFETTGLSPQKDHPTEVAVKKVGVDPATAKPYIKNYSSKIQLPAGVEVPEFITNLTGLTTEEVNSTGKSKIEVLADLQELIDMNTLVVAHNANFDLGFLFHHFGMEPAHFMCTRTVSILSEPHLNASLKNVYARMFGEQEQTHRAGDDVEMTMDVYNQFISEHGTDGMMFFKNKMVSMPDRELVYTPYNAIVLDFTQKYVSSRTHEEALEQNEKDLAWLSCLESAGVDNWSGIDYAYDLYQEEYPEEDE
jgi:DNA polymerase III subunit epsilon